MLAVPATEDKSNVMVLSVRKGDAIDSKCYLQRAFQERKKKVLPIKTPVHWSELTDDVVFAFLFLWGLWRFC